jgi:Icc-related predicted phosphoesterase
MGPIYKRRLPALFIVIAILLLTACSYNANHIPDTSPSASMSVTDTTPAPSALDASAPSSKPSAALQTATAPSEEMLSEALPANVSNTSVKTGTQVAGSSTLISKITVTFYGDASTAKGFTWYTNQDSKSSAVQVVKKVGPSPDFSQAVTFTGTVADPHNSPDELVHKAAATGLVSDTAYYYRVGDAALNLWSDPGVFTTAPTSGPFTFIDLSDTQFAGQAGSKVASDTISTALAQSGNAGFIINNGDVVDNKSEELWNLLLKNAQSSLMNMTIMPATGNHDAGNSTFIDHFNLDTPSKKTSTGAYYSVNYSNAHFVVLNTNESSGSYDEFSDAQIDWLKADIGAAKNAGAKWIIVVMHIGPYSTAEHSADSNVKDTREKIPSLFHKLGVDLVLQGHDHVYERSKPIADEGAVEESITTENWGGSPVNYIADPKGTIYLTPGTAGTKHYYQNAGLSQSYLNLFDIADGPYKGDPDLNNQETFVSVTIDGNKLTTTAYQVSKTINSSKPYIIDQFGIKKNN